VLKIVHYPDPLLSERAKPVRRINRDLLSLIEEMFDAMYEGRGVGLAAPQIGQGIRLCVVNTTGEPHDEIALVNPVLVESTGQATDDEGCLSVPGVRSSVTRAAHVKVRAYDADGKEIEIEADGLEARALQHEIDHLDGRLFFDLLGEAGRMTLRSRLKALEEEYRKEK